MAGSLLVIGAAAGSTLGVTTPLGVTFQGSGAAQQQVRRVEGLLLTSNRDRLAICVQAVGVDSSLQKKAKSEIEEALTEVARHPRWEASGLGVASPVVDIGCPSPPSVYRAGVRLDRAGGKGLLVSPLVLVDEPSEYRAFVFILPPSEFDRLFAGAEPYVSEELFAMGEVTTGLYLSSAELNDQPSLTEKLKRPIGLWEPSRW
ncbi:MAG: hypothetical protein A2W34_06685 [Chloroflexi bacterium RBG_16_64_32]|nr:MAG: hypothetical protein A2W34_06685 [Chloroflexi bacterium RBG_16_64_32]